MNRLYLAGPMSGLPGNNYGIFNAEAARLRALGWQVENPAENPAPTDESWLAYMRMAIVQLVQCDAIAMLPQWQNSRGACVEHTLAISLDMPVLRAKDITEGP